MTNEHHDRAEQLALFRYRVISEAASPRLSPAERGRLARELAARTWATPEGTERQVSRTSIDRWIAAYRKDGLAGLAPVPRSDRGRPRAGRQWLEEAARLRRTVPARSSAQIVDIIGRAHGVWLSERTVREHLHRLGLSRQALSAAPARAFGRFEAAGNTGPRWAPWPGASPHCASPSGCGAPGPDRGRPGGVRLGRYPRTRGAPARPGGTAHAPELLGVIGACPETKTWASPRRPPEPDLAGARNKALLVVGFVGALRRSELVALDWEHVNDHPQGLVATIPRSNTNQEGTEPELVVLPIGPNPGRCSVRASVLGRAGCRQLRPSLPPGFHGQQGRRPTPQRPNRQLPGTGRDQAGRHRPARPLRPLIAGRLRHLRSPAGSERPGHRPPDPAPFYGDPGAVTGP